MADNSSDSACPVDHKTRDAWLEQARASEAAKSQAPQSCPVDHTKMKPKTWSETIGSYLWSSPAAPAAQPSPQPPSNLDTNRVVSTIPRIASMSPDCPVDHGASANPANHEVESGADAATGNWVYPSEKMFSDAMKRKGYDARETDMKTVVPIHNAVNEKAWEHIKKWEEPYLAKSK